MKFNFKAKDKNGKQQEGMITASSKEAALMILQNNNLFPISIAPQKEGGISKELLKYYERVSDKELVVFFRQLSILVEARVPIILALEAIKDQSENKFFSRVIQEMMGDVEEGMPFSTSMEKQKDVFSSLTVNIVRAGETSGNLAKAISYVAENIERNYVLTSRVKAAMIYPGIVLSVFFVIGFLTMTFIIPKLTQIIKEMGAEVPWYTQVVIVVSDFMQNYWWAVALLIFGVVGGFLYYLKTEEGKKEWDFIKIRLPIVGVIFRYVYITRFAENLAVLLDGGIPIIKALSVVSGVVNNVVFEEVFLQAAEEVKKGGSMSSVLKKNALIPPIVSQMVKIGEESGQIDSVLKHVSRFYDRETEQMTRNLSTLLEPVLMVIIGIAVGFMAFAILMPIYNIAGQIK